MSLMKELPLVSIIMPAYNRINVIGEAIDSCLVQTYRNIEVIICDDHSTDGTKEYVMHRVLNDTRIKFCETPKNKKGANAARNTAIHMAKGKYVTFLDTDDYLLKDSIENRLKIFEENKKVALVYGNVYCECQGRRSKWIYHDLTREKIDQKKFLMENLALCIQNSIMLKAGVFKHIGMLDEEQKGWTDDGLVVAVGMRYPIRHCGKFLSVNRKSTESMTSNKWNMYKGCKIMVRKYKKEIIRYASFKRYMLWKVRLFSAFCYAKEAECDNTILKEIWIFLHEWTRDKLKPYFQVYCE